jgi:hypothetical protein
MSIRIPKHRFHQGSGQALVQINGCRVYLGKHGSEESKEKYQRLVVEWLSNGHGDDLAARRHQRAQSVRPGRGVGFLLVDLVADPQ